jgi:hypothetical protein
MIHDPTRKATKGLINMKTKETTTGKEPVIETKQHMATLRFLAELALIIPQEHDDMAIDLNELLSQN